MKIFFTTHLYFLVKKFTFLGVFAKTFLFAIKPSKCPAKDEKGGKSETFHKQCKMGLTGLHDSPARIKIAFL